jgi:hypothetical protein
LLIHTWEKRSKRLIGNLTEAEFGTMTVAADFKYWPYNNAKSISGIIYGLTAYLGLRWLCALFYVSKSFVPYTHLPALTATT